MLKLFKSNTLNLIGKQFSIRMQSTTVPAIGKTVELRKINQVGHITLNRPKALNALDLEMVNLLQSHLSECERDENIKMVLVKGAGGTAFCAGGDVKSIRENFLNGKHQVALEFFKGEYILDYHINNLRKPYVALLNGITMGGGVGISVHGKYRVATEKTMFAMPETAIGFFADVGGSYFLPRLKDNLGLYLALTGHRLKGQDVKKVGLATHFVSGAKLDSLEKEFLETSGLNPEKVDEILKRHDEKVADDFDTTHIKRCFSANRLEQIFENLEKDDSEWARQQLKLLRKMSPRSLKITIRQLELGATKSLKECFEMEYQMGWRFGKNSDMVEGVRALLVDKCNQPKWNPATHQEVDKKMVDWYFEPALPDEDKLVLPPASKL
jgi:3-hydroxyisobutyryl-CoA hydrolase